MSAFRIEVADLLARPAARRAVDLTELVDNLVGTSARVEDPVQVVLTLERIPEGIVARGTIRAGWRAQCSLCLADLDEVLEVHVDELFEHRPVDGETYLIEHDTIDLEQLVRDTVLLDLPLAPRCVSSCTPALPVVGDDEEPLDPRWRALSELEL
jgi:uncharacterized protein